MNEVQITPVMLVKTLENKNNFFVKNKIEIKYIKIKIK